ncbi:MAG: AMP-binding protein, partial [Dehalococcoidia bacterium]|nr:AMP-binding protein [Dehalococcoidia bacterium]
MIEGYPEISRDVASLKVAPNLKDWAAARESFSWDDMWAELDTPNGLINKAHECVDRHANGANADKTAIIWQAADDHVERFTYSDFKKQSNKVANALKGLGIEKGERVFILADRIPELYFSCFGILKLGAIMAPLFSAFGPEPIKERVQRAEGSVIITTPKLLPKVNAIR